MNTTPFEIIRPTLPSLQSLGLLPDSARGTEGDVRSFCSDDSGDAMIWVCEPTIPLNTRLTGDIAAKQFLAMESRPSELCLVNQLFMHRRVLTASISLRTSRFERPPNLRRSLFF